MNQTEAQKAYKRFDRKSKLISTALIAAGFICLVLFLICSRQNNLIGLLISIAALVLWFVVLCIIATRLNRIRLRLYHQAYGADAQTVHTGLFGELMAEFEWNQFAGLTDAKVIFAEAHGNTIELELRRSSHTCHIIIDPGAIYMVLDEESSEPIEAELPLANFSDISQIFTAIRAFVEHL